MVSTNNMSLVTVSTQSPVVLIAYLWWKIIKQVMKDNQECHIISLKEPGNTWPIYD